LLEIKEIKSLKIYEIAEILGYTAPETTNLSRSNSPERPRARKFIAENPCDAVQRPKAPYRAKPILPVSAWRLILDDCLRHDRGLLWWIVPVLFDGLRNAESRRAKPENFRDGVVDLDAGEQVKLNVRRAVKLSAAARAWLAVAGKRDLSNLRRRRVAMLERTGLAWPKNCHRHSFCSYSLELFGSRETARKANHSEKTLFTNYANKVTKAESKRFFGLRPILPQRTQRSHR
jgi:hypothetical protein